jgi:hypothetical protein
MNTTLLKWIGIAFAGALLVGVAWFSLASKKAPTPVPQQNTSLPSAGTATPVASTTVQGTPGIVVDAGGTGVVATDFIHNRVTLKDEANPGGYLLAGNFGYCYPDIGRCQAGPEVPYSVYFDTVYQTFTITLIREPIGQARLDAEAFLERTLGLRKDQLCALNYSVNVTRYVNEQFTGRNLGFSFCPGAAVLP